MNDQIKEAIRQEAATRFPELEGDYLVFNMQIRKQQNLFIAGAEYALSEKEEEWISVETRLPTIEDADENGKVLLYRLQNENQSALAKTIHDWDMVKHCEDGCSWWRKLPSPPKTK